MDLSAGFIDASFVRSSVCFQLLDTFFGKLQFLNCPLSKISGVLFRFVCANLYTPNYLGHLIHKV